MQSAIFESFDYQNWKKWIQERCHGYDSLTSLNLFRDPNPHYAIIDAYKTIGDNEVQSLFINALMVVINDELSLCREFFVQSDFEKFEEESLYLERALAAFHQLKLNTENYRTNLIIRDCFNFYFQPEIKIKFEFSQLRRLILILRDQITDPLSEKELTDALKSNETYVVAFEILLAKNNISAIEEYFPVYVEKAYSLRSKPLIKVEVNQILKSIGNNNFKKNSIEEAFRIAISKIPEKMKDDVLKILKEAGLNPKSYKPVKKAILDRAEFIYVDENYVFGQNYNNFISKLIDILLFRLNSNGHKKITQKKYPVGRIPWDVMASYLFINAFDFCCDPYYCIPPRDNLINVVQFGWGVNFTAFTPNIPAIMKSKLVNTDLPTEDRLKGFIDEMTSQKNDCFIGVLGETAAAIEVINALKSNFLYGSKIISFKNTIDLKVWLCQSTTTSNIVICDRGLARDINNLGYDEISRTNRIDRSNFDRVNSYSFADNCHELIFSFKEKIPAGFIYPRIDEEWYLEVVTSLKETVINNFEEIDWAKISIELDKVGITALSEKEFFIDSLELYKDENFMTVYNNKLMREERFEEGIEIRKRYFSN